jgi:hypothetical protein
VTEMAEEIIPTVLLKKLFVANHNKGFFDSAIFKISFRQPNEDRYFVPYEIRKYGSKIFW